MAQFIKAKKVDAVKKDRDGVAGYEITEVSGMTRWQDEDSFLSGHTQVGDDDVEQDFDDDDIVIDDE